MYASIFYSFLFRALRNTVIRTVIAALCVISTSVNGLFKRLSQSPGIPVQDPSVSYWTVPPSSIAKHGSEREDALVDYADVVIIGSGITGTSFTRTILDYDAELGSKDHPLQIVMLEARDTCSGATGRNGGHITPVLYHDYVKLKKQHGMETAQRIIRFRLAHISEFISVASEEGLTDDSQCREVETFDVFYDEGMFNTAKKDLVAYQKDMPIESSNFKIYEGDSLKNLHLSPAVMGSISTRGGAMHPYRFVTGILARLLRSYKSNFHLYTHTPCTQVTTRESTQSMPLYSVTTPRGEILTPHVVHATNAWVSHLLPGMHEKIIPGRGVMTAQTCLSCERKILEAPAAGNSTGQRSFIFFPSNSDGIFDYLTQQPSTSKAPSSYPPPFGEWMFGGGFARDNAFLSEFGNVDDRGWNGGTAKYLSTALSQYFDNDNSEVKGDVLAVWGGILGFSVDERPWVGRVPEKISRRPPPSAGSSYHTDTSSSSSTQLAPSGEWMAAGYTGEGMVHAWLSGKTLAYMVLGHDKSSGLHMNDDTQQLVESSGRDVVDSLPTSFRVTEERWRNICIEDMIYAYLW